MSFSLEVAVRRAVDRWRNIIRRMPAQIRQKRLAPQLRQLLDDVFGQRRHDTRLGLRSGNYRRL
jgi:hypothetical protein